MSDLVFYDASRPPAHPPATDGVAFYIGGDTPHVWTPAEIRAQPARYRLPIWVRSNPAQVNALVDAGDALGALRSIGAPRGIVLALDSETSIDPVYVKAFFTAIRGGGYVLLDYGSQDYVFGNKNPDGYYWGADWTGTEHIDQGDQGTQYENDGSWDLSVFKPGLPFWDTRPGKPTPAPITYNPERAVKTLPEIRQGATGANVRTIQGLCTARGYDTAVDGIFGPKTTVSVRLVQRAAGIGVDGIVGPQTWPVLIGVA